MNVQELLVEITEKIDQIERDAIEGRDAAQYASSYARDAMNEASNAEDNADNAEREANNVLETVEELREQINELEERLQEEGSESGGSSLQKDMNKWKTKVLKVHQDGANPEQIASKLDIGVFLVKHILENRAP